MKIFLVIRSDEKIGWHFGGAFSNEQAAHDCAEDPAFLPCHVEIHEIDESHVSDAY